MTSTALTDNTNVRMLDMGLLLLLQQRSARQHTPGLDTTTSSVTTHFPQKT